MNEKLQEILHNTGTSKNQRYELLYKYWEADPTGVAQDPDFQGVVENDPEFKNYLGTRFKNEYAREMNKARVDAVPGWVKVAPYLALVCFLLAWLLNSEMFFGICLVLFCGSMLFRLITGTAYRTPSPYFQSLLIFLLLVGIWMALSGFVSLIGLRIQF